jgi:hypothetical protein
MSRGCPAVVLVVPGSERRGVAFEAERDDVVGHHAFDDVELAERDRHLADVRARLDVEAKHARDAGQLLVVGIAEAARADATERRRRGMEPRHTDRSAERTGNAIERPMAGPLGALAHALAHVQRGGDMPRHLAEPELDQQARRRGIGPGVVVRGLGKARDPRHWTCSG